MKTFTLESPGMLADYDYLSRLSMDRWAWEYLRRNDEFRRDASVRSKDDISERMAPCAPIRMLKARTSQTLAERWGLVLMPDPNKNGIDADVVWNRASLPGPGRNQLQPARGRPDLRYLGAEHAVLPDDPHQ